MHAAMLKHEDLAAEDDFVTKTSKSRKKAAIRANASSNSDATAATNGSSGGAEDASSGAPRSATPSGNGHGANSHSSSGPGGAAAAAGGDGISLRPRTMFTVKGRGRTESEGSPAYRPQWSKDGEGFVSNLSSGREGEHAGDSRSESARRKGKVLRYTKEELLALHFVSKEPSPLIAETAVASEHSLPPVNTLPFDYEEIYKQWALNRNRGRGRGRTAQGTEGTTQRTRTDGRWEEGKWDRTKSGNRSGEDSNERWARGASVETENPNDIWDDVSPGGMESMELDLSSMAAASEKFRREMDAMREQEQQKASNLSNENDMDEFDKKLEDAAAAGQFEDSDNEEAPWDMPDEADTAKGEFELAGSHAMPVQETPIETHPVQQQPPPEEPTFSFPTLTDAGNGFGLEPLAIPRVEVRDEWFYLDPQGLQQGPFKTVEMREWFEAGYFKPHLPIRFGREGSFTPLANHFVQGQIPFAAPPQPSPSGGLGELLRVNEQQRLMEMHQQHQQQQQRMLQLQQQQEHQRLLQLGQEEKIRMEMQRLEIARQHQSHMFQQQQLLHQQQQQQQQQQQAMLLQQQSSWQRSHRDGMMSALGIFETPENEAKDRFRPDPTVPSHFQHLSAQPQFDLRQAPHPADPVFVDHSVQQQASTSWPQRSSPQRFGEAPSQGMFMGDIQQEPASLSPQAVTSQPQHQDLGVGWGAETTETEASSSLRDLLLGSTIRQSEQQRQEEEYREELVASAPDALEEQHSERQSESNTASSPLELCPATEAPVEEEVEPVVAEEVPPPSPEKPEPKIESGVWAQVQPGRTKSLKDIQEEEQQQMRKSLEEQGDAANLARMGAQLKMMLGVNSTGSAGTSAPAPPAPPAPRAAPASPAPTPAQAAKPAQVAKPAPPAAAAPPAQRAPAKPRAPAAQPPTPSVWGAPPAPLAAQTKKSMREILEEEERLAAERAKRTESATVSGSHWMNVVAGTAGPSPAVPKPSRLGPMPTSVLKSTTRRASATTASPAAAPPAISTSTAENDASFWNFGVAQQPPSSQSTTAVSSFGLSTVPSEFMAWCGKQLKTINGSSDLTLVEYCATLEDPGEIREYLAAYLGSTPRVSAFATEFIQRKKSLPTAKKAPTPFTASASESTTPDSASGKKTRRRAKGQKVDPAALLNYSVRG